MVAKYLQLKVYRKAVQKESKDKRSLLSLELRPFNIGQRKVFFRHRILECSCVRKETVDMNIFITSRNSDRKKQLLEKRVDLSRE